MAIWLAPALKAVLPHIGSIVSAVAPAFTQKKTEAVANQMQLLQDQIAELQSAATQNATHIKDLATQLQSTVAALELAARAAEARLRWALGFSIAAVTLTVIGLTAALVLVLAK